jgi:hypothetical protein
MIAKTLKSSAPAPPSNRPTKHTKCSPCGEFPTARTPALDPPTPDPEIKQVEKSITIINSKTCGRHTSVNRPKSVTDVENSIVKLEASPLKSAFGIHLGAGFFATVCHLFRTDAYRQSGGDDKTYLRATSIRDSDLTFLLRVVFSDTAADIAILRPLLPYQDEVESRVGEVAVTQIPALKVSRSSLPSKLWVRNLDGRWSQGKANNRKPFSDPGRPGMVDLILDEEDYRLPIGSCGNPFVDDDGEVHAIVRESSLGHPIGAGPVLRPNLPVWILDAIEKQPAAFAKRLEGSYPTSRHNFQSAISATRDCQPIGYRR